jgi:putative transposase
MIKAHKIRLHPTPEQAVYFAKAAGTSRFVWNWALAEWNRHDEAGEKPTALKLKKQFNEMRREQFPWTWEVTKNASDQPFLDLGKAFTAFFEGKARRPRFKSKKRSKLSFYLANDQFELGDHRIWVPKLGWVNMAENLRFVGKVTGARITKTADWWFVSIQVEMPDPLPVKKPAACGIDVGLNRLATLSVRERESRTKPSSKPPSRNFVRRTSGSIVAHSAQKIGRKHAGRWHGSIIGLPAYAMMSCTSSPLGLPTVMGSLALKISTSKDCSRIANSLVRSRMPHSANS